MLTRISDEQIMGMVRQVFRKTIPFGTFDLITQAIQAQLEADEKVVQALNKEHDKDVKQLYRMLNEKEEEKRRIVREIFETVDNMLDGMGLGEDNFKHSDWLAYQALKERWLK